MRLSILWRIMEIEEAVIAEADNTLRDLHNSSYDTKAEVNNCFIIHSKLFLVWKHTLSHFLEQLLITKNESNLSIKQIQQSLAEYKFSQNTDFIYRRVPGMAWNILRNVSLQFKGIFYLHLHPYSSLAKTCFLYQTGFLPGFKFSTSHLIRVLNLNIHCERKNLDIVGRTWNRGK